MKRIIQSRILLTALMIILAATATAVAWATEHLPQATPESMGVDSNMINEALDNAESLGFMKAMVIVRDGHLIGERNWMSGYDIPFQSRSVTKSVVSTLIGIAIDQGYISSVDDRMIDYLPESAIPDDVAKHEIRLFHLLTMTAGFDYDEDSEVVVWLGSPDPLGWILDKPLVAAPGQVFNYNTASSHLLSVVLSEATGMTTLEFADQVLFEPLGITERRWLRVGEYHNGGHNLFLRTEDLAKLGMLFTDGGVYGGRQIVPRYWTNLATYPQVGWHDSDPEFAARGYGYEWWLFETPDYPIYSAIGWGGQFSFCVPALDLVVAAHSQSPADPGAARAQENAIMRLIATDIIPAVADQRKWTVTGVEVPELAGIDDMVRTVMLENDIPNAAVAVAKDDRLVLAHGYTWGDSDIEITQPTSLFRIGTISNAISSIAIHQMIERGLVNHETSVTSMVDFDVQAGQSVDPFLAETTVDHLLSHSSGWNQDSGAIDPIMAGDRDIAARIGSAEPLLFEEILSFLGGQPMQFQPGSNWSYFPSNYLVLDALARQATGGDFVEWTMDQVYRAVGVSRARLGHSLQDQRAPAEVDYHGVLSGDPYSVNMENAFAVGGHVMAAPDLARVLSQLFDGEQKLLSNESRESMLEFPFAVSVMTGYGRGWANQDFFENINQTMGWLTDVGSGESSWGHPGAGPGLYAQAIHHPSGVTFVMLTNSDSNDGDLDDFPEIAEWPNHDLWSSVGIVEDEACAAVSTEAWLPVVTHTAGANNSTWRSDLDVLSRSSLDSRVRFRLHHDSGILEHEVELRAGQSIAVDDVVETMGASDSAPLQILGDEAFSVISRIYNQDSLGTYGQAIAPVGPSAGLRSGDSAVVMHLRENTESRSNIGILNGSRREAIVEIELFDGDGNQLADFTETVPGERTIQVNRVFERRAGRSDIDSGYAAISVVSGEMIHAYASLIDDLSNDATTIRPQTGNGKFLQWVPAAAHGPGVNASEWRTDLVLLNTTENDSWVKVSVLGDLVGEIDIEVPAGNQVFLEDVLSVLGIEGAGFLEVAASERILVHSRTYAWTPSGSFGQAVEAVALDQSLLEGDVRWLAGLRQADEFRSNIGLVNAGDEEAVVTIALFDAAGVILAEPRRVLAPGERIQLQEPYLAAGQDSIRGGRARVTISSGARVLCYASVIDNRSNDPTTVLPIE